MDIKAEWEKALKEKDCEKLLELFDDYIENIEDEDTLREELKKLVKIVIECEDPYDLAHEIAHVYAHLGEIEEGIELYRKIAERKKNSGEYVTALFHLANAYEHFGMPDKAIGVYEQLLELEKSRKEEALTLAHMALNYEELGDLERAIELMERAGELFAELGDERNYLVSLIDLAHFYYEKGEDEKAEEFINEVLKRPRDTEIEVNARLVEAEIHSGRGHYRDAFKSLSKALLKAREDEELFEYTFEMVTEFIEMLFNEGLYRELKDSLGIFVDVLEDDEGYRTFFEALRELAKFKLGEESRLEKIYNKIPEELREFIDELRKPKLDMSL